MKKVIYLLIVMVSIFSACNPLDEINDEIDAEANPIVGIDAFTMVTEDYVNIIEQGEDDPVDFYEMFESFNDLEDARTILPSFLSTRYPNWGEGSSVTVSFNIYDGNPGDDISDFTNANVYQLLISDYPTAGGGAFFPNENPESTLETILTTEFPTPIDGDIVRLQYNLFDMEPSAGFAVIYDGLFPDLFSTFTIVDQAGEQGWTEGSSFANGSGFANGSANENEDWLISPIIDLTGQQDVLFQINQRISFLDGAAEDFVNILVSTNYTGDPLTTNWDTITLNTVPDGSNSDFVLSEDFDFSAYDGETINIAFKYESSATSAPLWRIDFFQIKTAGFTGDTTTNSEYYKFFGGSWDNIEDVYYLSSADYDSMGEASGQPGQFNNFSGSVSSEDYLPTFLDIEFPFAQEGDELNMIYRFFGGGGIGTITRGNLYTVINGSWTPALSTIQFGFENGEWVPDNTIRYTLVSADYSTVAADLLTEPGFEAAAANLDNFGNFNRTTTSASSWSDTMMVRALGIVVNNLNPTAEDGQKYIVTFDMFNGASGSEDFKLIKEAGEWIANQPLN
ncbi:choice-of-anchor J domain-containing protein [Lacinutrix sp.]|uniref:choice-of-anchor J domain-containing protein n=1 Tax=Lacinutrix sp. TaxID=1937692 RepID=UPI0025C1AB41|nr:choice-of-anchor J domain-containing protein [Lacinutrix sp.]